MTMQWGTIEKQATANARQFVPHWVCLHCGHRGEWAFRDDGRLTCPNCGAHLVKMETKR